MKETEAESLHLHSNDKWVGSNQNVWRIWIQTNQKKLNEPFFNGPVDIIVFADIKIQRSMNRLCMRNTFYYVGMFEDEIEKKTCSPNGIHKLRFIRHNYTNTVTLSTINGPLFPVERKMYNNKTNERFLCEEKKTIRMSKCM